MSDPYAGLPPEYLALLDASEQSAVAAAPTVDQSASPAVDSQRSRQPTLEEEEAMDSYYQRESWLEHGGDRGPKKAEPTTYWSPTVIGE
ncbi:hypothetical protein [Nocardia lasii]|uniref:Uncharacterized protein n=1 Tax=Nocardia lasii TaxID=1616107 RepID=A0ABW1JTX1_9NOCA